jgi:hypothetical protein
MPMSYKSPGRALRDLRGINTVHYGKKVVHYYIEVEAKNVIPESGYYIEIVAKMSFRNLDICIEI